MFGALLWFLLARRRKAVKVRPDESSAMYHSALEYSSGITTEVKHGHMDVPPVYQSPEPVEVPGTMEPAELWQGNYRA